MLLAIAVISLHTGTDVFGMPGLSGFGFAAVNVFFVISGFYMAMILTEKYTSANPWVFYKSRLLRLFPAYFIGVLLGLIVTGSQLHATFHSLSLPGKIYMIVQNTLMIPQDLSSIICVRSNDGSCATMESLSANPPSWSLAVELGFYAIAPFVVRSARRTVAYFFAGVVYMVSLRLIDFPINSVDFLQQMTDSRPISYSVYPASFLFFAAGALGYQLSRGRVVPVYVLAFGGLFLLAFEPYWAVPFWQVPIFAAAVPTLFALTKSNRFDRTIGELSYPVYVVHYPLNEWLGTLPLLKQPGFRLLTEGSWVAIASIATAVLIHYSLDRVVNRYRASARFLLAAELPPEVLPSARAHRLLLLPKLAMIPYFALPAVLVASILATQA